MKKVAYLIVFLVVIGLSISCSTEEKSPDRNSVVEISAVYDAESDRHLFRTDTDSIPSGWTTFRFINGSPAAHFLLLDLMPEGKTVEDSEREIVPVFQEAMDLINEGMPEEGMAKLGELPEWFGEITFMGGPGVVSPGKTVETTVFLEPGNYVMECYIKTEEGIFHGVLGMVRDLTVTGETGEMEEPSNPTITMELTNEGFGVKGEPAAGHHLVAVHFNEDDPPLLGNDVHLARLNEDTDIEEVTEWMDWSQSRGLTSSPDNPAPAEFLGGTHEMPKGNTAYFTVELTEGRYAWISERPAADPLYEEFTVPAGEEIVTE